MSGSCAHSREPLVTGRSVSGRVESGPGSLCSGRCFPLKGRESGSGWWVVGSRRKRRVLLSEGTY